MKTQSLHFTLILLSSLALSTLTTISVAQTQDYSRVNLPDGAIARLGKGGVSYRDRGIAFSPDGRRLAVATSIGIWFYDTETFDEIVLLTGQKGEVTAVAFSPDGTTLAAGSGRVWEGTLKLWDVETGQNIATFQEQKGSVGSVVFSPDGTKLAAAGKLWDVETKQQLDMLQDKGLDLTFSPDGKILAGTSGRTLPRTSRNDVAMWEGIIKLYGVETGQLLNTLIATRRTKWGEPRERVESIAFSPDSTKIASAAGHDVKLWDVETGENIATFQGQKGKVESIAFSPNGTKLAVGADKGVKLLNILTGKHIDLLGAMWIQSVAFSPDGKTLASASGTGVRLWEVSTGKSLTALQRHPRIVNAVTFSPDGLTLASTSWSGTAEIWEIVTGQRITTLGQPPNFALSLAYSPDGTRLVMGSYNMKTTEHTVKLRDVSTGENLSTLHGHTGFVTTVAYSPDGTKIASGSEDKTVKVWAVETGQNLAILQGHQQVINSIAFSPDGTKLASGSDDRTIRLWELSTGRALHTLSKESVNKLQIDDEVGTETERFMSPVKSVAFSPDGLILASLDEDIGGNMDDGDAIKLWEVETGKHIAILTDGTDFPGWAVAFSPDGTKLASGSWDFTVKLWDVSMQKHIATFPGHIGRVSSVAFSPDGTKLASGSYDGTVLVWNIELDND